MLNDGTDFVSGQSDWRLVGRKALAVNLSDLAAMAARPVAALVSLLLPRHEGLQIAQSLYGGLLAWRRVRSAHRRRRHELVGRSGGDQRHSHRSNHSERVLAAQRRMPRRPDPGHRQLRGQHSGAAIRVRAARPRGAALNAEYRIHAATDVSDGLSLDLSHLLEASGCGAELRLDWIPVSDDARRLAASAEGSSESALDHAIGDGEDFELILAVPPTRPNASAGGSALGRAAQPDRAIHRRTRSVADRGIDRTPAAGSPRLSALMRKVPGPILPQPLPVIGFCASSRGRRIRLECGSRVRSGKAINVGFRSAKARTFAERKPTIFHPVPRNPKR
jgi:thiamine-monophosphate kinase